MIINEHITLNDFIDVTTNYEKVKLSDKVKEKIVKSNSYIEKIIKNGKPVYGITTGFGSLNNKFIENKDLEDLQLNLIKSHAIGAGHPSPIKIVRGMLLLRLVCITKGCSGVRLEIAEKLVEALNKNFIPYVPIQGTVGASGDLCPLSHMIYSLLGESKAYDIETNTFVDSKNVMKKLNMEPMVKLNAKEGLALNNGTQFITSYTAHALYDANKIMKLSNLIAALSIEALHGVNYAFDERIHNVKHHNGQIMVAKEMREYLCPNKEESEIHKNHTKNKVQDAYSLRCLPQIHGPSYDLLKFINKVVVTEMNSANDNPLIFDGTPLSGGNFHGQYIGMVADQLALAMSYLCNISERRLERMVNSSLNGFMPSFLVKNPGLNSGFMIVQYASAGITAENRKLANPGSVDTIPTCEGFEDIVSMAGYPARKALDSVENTYKVLSYELMTACQALEFTKEKPHERLYNLYQYVRSKTLNVENDRYMKEDYDIILKMLKSNELMKFTVNPTNHTK